MWDGRRGRYEVWFLTMSDPRAATGYWIRYTLRAPVAGPPEPRVWFARFDRDDPTRTFGVNAGVPPGDLAFEEGAFEVRMGDSMLRSGRAAGGLAGGGHEVRWDLEFPTGGPTYRMLPDPFYRGGLAPTKPYTPNVDVRFSGVVEVDGERLSIDGVPGQQGHLYGSRHAERWAWAYCDSFEEDGFAFQALSAQGRRGPFLTPFTTFAGLRVGGDWVRLGGASRRRSWDLGTWRIRLENRRYRLEGEVRAPAKAMVRARYHDPDDTPRHCHNSEVASSRLSLWQRRADGWDQVAELVSDGTTHAEWAGRTPAVAVETEHLEVP